MIWILSLATGVVLAAWSYLRTDSAPMAVRAPLALLRALAITLLVALLLNASAGARRRPAPLVALDISESWRRGGDSALWVRARETARRAGGDSVLLLGDSVRAGRAPAVPADNATRLQPLVERALGSGRPVVLVTDGEVDDPGAAGALPAGSRVDVLRAPARPDVGLVSLEAPRAAVAADTVALRVTLRAGAAPTGAGVLTVREGNRTVATQDVPPLRAGEDRVLSLDAPIGSASGSEELSAAIRVPGDVEPRNDTVGVALEVGRAVGAVVVSSSPDLDVRYLLPVLRGAVALPTRAYFRVAPGAWRQGESLAPVAEGDVRRALREAPLAVIHGDTALLGAPMSVTTGSLALLVPPSASDGEWYAVAAPPSPLAAALSDTPWDSLSPLDVAASVPDGDWQGLVTARGRRFDRRTAITGRSLPRRRVVVAAGGLWRWAFRGGAGANAFAALWGSIFDWLSAERADTRAAFPAEGMLRAGEPVRWRRGSGADSTVTVRLTRRGRAHAGEDSVVLHFGASGMVAESPPLPSGVYDVRVPRGNALLVVNPSREWLPASPTVRAGGVGGQPALAAAPSVRQAGWAYLLLLVALCAEWLLRRRVGLR